MPPRRARATRRCVFQPVLQHHAAPSEGAAPSLETATSWRSSGDHGRQAAAGPGRPAHPAIQSLADEADDAGQPLYPALGRPPAIRWRLRHGRVHARIILYLSCRQALAAEVRKRRHECTENLNPHVMVCLLYTSDAADDLLCVDLGG